MSKIKSCIRIPCIFLLFGQSLAELREEESLLLTERINLKNVCFFDFFSWDIFLFLLCCFLNLNMSYWIYLNTEILIIY